MSIAVDGSTATLTANSTLGLFRGLTTFTQLFYERSGQIYAVEAPISQAILEKLLRRHNVAIERDLLSAS